MKATKKTIRPRKPKQSMPLIDTNELCKDLVIMAGFLDDRRVADKIYKAVRQLQILDKLAKDAAPTQF